MYTDLTWGIIYMNSSKVESFSCLLHWIPIVLILIVIHISVITTGISQHYNYPIPSIGCTTVKTIHISPEGLIIGRKKTGGLYYNIDYNLTNPPLAVRSV